MPYGKQPLATRHRLYLRHMRVKILLALLLLAATATAQERSRTERKVRHKLAKGKAYPAIRLCTGALGNEGGPVFHLLRAEGYNSIAKFRKAQADARQAMHLLPDSVGGLFQLAVAEQGLGLLDSADLHFTAVLERTPGVEALYHRALVRKLQGRLAEAIRDVDRALAMRNANEKESSGLHRVKGELAAMTGDTLLARTELNKAIALGPDDPVNYNSRGYYLHAWRGDHRAAIADYDHALKLNPNYSYAFNNRGWSLYKLGETEKGLRDIARARRRKPGNPYVYRNLGVIALETGDTTEACLMLQKALDHGFTGLYGTEVEDRMAESCRKAAESNPQPVQPPKKKALNPKTADPPARINAP